MRSRDCTHMYAGLFIAIFYPDSVDGPEEMVPQSFTSPRPSETLSTLPLRKLGASIGVEGLLLPSNPQAEPRQTMY